jgi:hypothetical protein
MTPRPRGKVGAAGRPSILSLNFHSALCIAVQRGAKFGSALAHPFVCLADGARPMSHEFRVSVRDHCQHFGNCALILRSRCDEWIIALPGKHVGKTSPRRNPAMSIYRFWALIVPH